MCLSKCTFYHCQYVCNCCLKQLIISYLTKSECIWKSLWIVSYTVTSWRCLRHRRRQRLALKETVFNVFPCFVSCMWCRTLIECILPNYEKTTKKGTKNQTHCIVKKKQPKHVFIIMKSATIYNMHIFTNNEINRKFLWTSHGGKPMHEYQLFKAWGFLKMFRTNHI